MENDQILELPEKSDDDEKRSEEEQIESSHILDGMVWTYNCKRMTRRRPVALFHDMIDVSEVNAYAYVVW